MVIISMILFTIVFVAQIVLFALFFLEKKRSNQRNDALLQYIDRSCNTFKKEIDGRINQQSAEIRSMEDLVTEKVNSISISYSEAQQAADKVNEFATGLASIFDYDPLIAIKKGRNKEAT